MTSYNADEILFREFYQMTDELDELDEASRAVIDAAYDRLEDSRDSLFSFAAQADGLQGLSVPSNDIERDRNIRTRPISTQRVMEQNRSNTSAHSVNPPTTLMVEGSRRRRSIRSSSNLSNDTGYLTHARRSILESHLRSLQRLLALSSSSEFLARRVAQRAPAINAGNSDHPDESNEDTPSLDFTRNSPMPSNSRVESRAAAAHLRLSLLPNPNVRPANNRNQPSLTRTRTVRSNSLTALPQTSGPHLRPSQLTSHSSGRVFSEDGFATRVLDDFVRMDWPQHSGVESFDTAIGPNPSTTSGSEGQEVDHRSSRPWTFSQAPDINDTTIFAPFSRSEIQTDRENITDSRDSSGDEFFVYSDPSERSSSRIDRRLSIESDQISSSQTKARTRTTTSEKALVLKRLFGTRPDEAYVANNPLPGRLFRTDTPSNHKSDHIIVKIDTTAGR